ncbi:subtilisin-like peptidase, peptidase S8_Novo_like family [Psychroflexus torquis ATCC 700755]|uniref:Subtilisin-like peptidase, peptidase S8_Novo_like family n=1 Tax=Psychroflexus torquis (strain ATCC 700755 / CIP 106069 / ACAM 623) TaxID=313595 RepID=K4IRK4_PSYTT|nr:S8 family peptidase [Psychroflexus torquis]AFU68090.1 subtilisin-like peptidase, peptidase S8_Novo_like family [Psychroflexus torquis ATCC 700755]
MTTKTVKIGAWGLLFSGFLIGCASGPKITSEPIPNLQNAKAKTSELTDDELEVWGSKDLLKDTIPGMSVDRAYQEIIKDYKGESVIVAVLDSGIDIEHEDFEGVIWTNIDEIPENGIDDDKNGFVDDIHGWNFLGDVVEENLEYTRIVRDYQDKFEGKSESDVSEDNLEAFKLYKSAKAEYDKELTSTNASLNRYVTMNNQLQEAEESLKIELDVDKLGIENLTAYEPKDDISLNQKMLLLNVMNNIGEDLGDIEDQLAQAMEYFGNRTKYHFNLELNARAEILGDDPDDFSTRFYGNNQVSGPNEDKKDAKHGTHVAGIIAANRLNDKGVKGVAGNVLIMPIRAVPDGDEYDKDIAMGIRYAVDNGAKVINTSFGKYFSTHPEWVMEAIAYAAENDVLIVNAAGNEGIDLDETRVYPNDETPENPINFVDNFINVGSITSEYGGNLISGFSNYGDNSVDVFAPGSSIYATTPLNTYEFLQGTSMASPNVAGVAAMVRSIYPKLSAAQVKQILMDSGLSTDQEVVLGGDSENTLPFDEISVSGKMVNMYNALILASKTKK